MKTNLYPPFQLKSLVQYWRNTLADEDLMGLDSSAFPVKTVANVIYSGVLDKDSVSRLQQIWSESKKLTMWSQTAADITSCNDDLIPIIILGRGFAPKHEHGKTITTKSSSAFYYTLHIPASIDSSGLLTYSELSVPWIGRQYLYPNEEADENTPMIGDVSVYDDWLNENPLGELSWAEFMKWCDDLCRHVIGEKIPEGFIALSDYRIDISKSVKNAARSLCQLYDALQQENQFPVLFSRICHGREEHYNVDSDLRIRKLASARGTMSNAYGLADSQADAIAAYKDLAAGEVLAVNGPPGTGKTTLLQSIIASEVVATAMEGGLPAVIVGVSTNNRAVVNINRSLNEIFQENPGSSLFTWAKRWIENANTYGLYLPAGEDKAKEAKSNGYKIAVKVGQKWTEFPECETDKGYLASNKLYWIKCYADTYSIKPDSIEICLDKIREDLHEINKKIMKIQGCLEDYQAISNWWLITAQGSTPNAYIEKEDVFLTVAIDQTKVAVSRLYGICINAKENRDLLYSKSIVAEEEYKKSYDDQQVHIRNLMGIKSQINTACAPHGLLESFAELFQFSRRLFNYKRIARIFSIAAREPLVNTLFEREIHSKDPTIWLDRADQIVKAASVKLAQLANEQIISEKAFSEEVTKADENLRSAIKNHHLMNKNLEKENQHKITRLRELAERSQELDIKRAELESAYERLRYLSVTEFLVDEKKIDPPEIPPSVKDFDSLLDMTWRHMAFQKAMRYWEGRWIIDAEAVQEDRISTNNGRTATEVRFRRWCMLTPCLIMTAHSLPKYFRFTSKGQGDEYISNFLFDYIDLLIMDEAGQVAPHVGAAVFALANRAVVVGDIYQIEPFSKLTRGTDRANSIRADLSGFWRDGYPATTHVVSDPGTGAPQGSIMRLAQMATMSVSPGTEKEPGIFLSEHRRCRSEIVEYCNELIYQGRLDPLTPATNKEPPLRPLMWAHVRGVVKNVGGSRANSPEANSIAEWIVNNAEAWCLHYEKPLEDIVAVITPFNPQAGLISKALSQRGKQYAKITVGTVHSLQGAEKPIVVFSPTYNADTVKGMFFDNKPNMLNVAVSRAKDSFVVIGDMRLFRNKGRSPSSILGEMLFVDARNELSDVDGNHRFSRELLVNAERISTLERHRNVLRSALLDASRNQIILIASPWITTKAIRDDDLVALIAEAVEQRGARILIVVDRELAVRTPEYCGKEALAIMQKAGATINLIANMHNKTLIIGSSEIIEGSFNWLSAQRNKGDKYIRHEVSWRITGENAPVSIRSALEEFGKLGVEI